MLYRFLLSSTAQRSFLANASLPFLVLLWLAFLSGCGMEKIPAQPAAAKLTWVTPADISYGTPLTTTQLNAQFSVPGSISYQPALGTILDAGTQVLTATFLPDEGTSGAVVQSVALTVRPVQAAISWSSPAPIQAGTPLSSQQLSARATQEGAITYSPALGSVLPAGSQQLTASFTPTNTRDILPSQATVRLQVLPKSKQAPVLAWPTPGPIQYGAPLTEVQLNANSSVAGTISYSPTLGSVLSAGSHQLTASFIPSDGNDYLPATSTITLVVTPAKPSLKWPSPKPIKQGTSLNAAQLNASASVPGTFTYTPSFGSVLDAGTQPLTAVFTPTDATNYLTAQTNTTLQVIAQPTSPALAWTAPSQITYGTPLSTVQLNASASVPGTFTYSPSLGTVLNAGIHQLSVTFSPTDSSKYVTVTGNTSILVKPFQPVLSWRTPSAIQAGTPLSTTQLNAASPIQGTISYSPALGSILPAGMQQLTATFVPSDSQDYLPVQASVLIHVLPVNQTAPSLSWSTPADITYGTALSSTQFNASASVPGSFAYYPAPGTVLAAGVHQVSVTFQPSDTTTYVPATATVNITVHPAQPTIIWSSPSPIQQGSALGTAQLSASTSIPGSFTYTPGLGTVLASGTQQLTATFTPTDTQDYLSAQATIPLSVLPAPVTLTVSPAVLPLGQSTIVVSGGTFSPAATVTVGGRQATVMNVSSTTLTVSAFVAPWQSGAALVQVSDAALQSGSGTASAPIVATQASFDAAARFSRQAAFGPRPDVVLHIQQVGLEGFLDEQVQLPAFNYDQQHGAPTEWVQNTVLGQNVLRQRVAYALSSFLVTYSQNFLFQDYAMWEHTLEQDAFGNFRTLMTDVALNPCMGRTLNLDQNWATTTPNQHPNQNFAREFMQLFTIGPNMLNDDGSQILDAQGNPVPSYGQNDVFAMTNALTGWGTPPPVNSQWSLYGVDFSLPMVPFDAYHDQTSKTLFGNITLPANQTATQDMKLAFDAVFAHPNVPPFIATRLIQQLVTSNPSPEYVTRISHVFENNGNGVRGDLQAVVKAILLDPEARSGDTGTYNAQFGTLHDPMTLFLEALNGMQVAPNDDQFVSNSAIPAENIFAAPSVFGYDSPTYQIPGSTLTSPAFQLVNDKNLIAQGQLLEAVTQGQIFVNWATGPSWLETTFRSIPDYVEAVNHLFFSGRLTQDQQSILLNHANSTQGSLTDQMHEIAFLALNSDSFGVAH